MNPQAFRFLLLFAATVCTSVPGIAAAQDAHELTLDRTHAVGQVYSFGSQGYRTTQMIQTLDGQQVGEETRLIEGRLTGTVRITQVTEEGEVTGVVVIPAEYSGKVDGEDVRIDIDKPYQLSVVEEELVVKDADGRPLPPEATEVLDVLLSFMMDTDPGESSEDVMFNLNQPRQVGASWQCNHELLAEDFSESGELSLEPEQIESEFRFVELGQVFGQDAAKLELDIDFEGFTVPALAQQGFEMKQSIGSLKLRGMLPLDPASTDGNISVLMDMAMTAIGTLPDGQGTMELQFAIQNQVQSEYELQE